MKTPLHQKRVRFYFAGANIAYFVGFSKFFAENLAPPAANTTAAGRLLRRRKLARDGSAAIGSQTVELNILIVSKITWESPWSGRGGTTLPFCL
jgi:hypothetical protein